MNLFKNGLLTDKRNKEENVPIQTDDGYIIEMLDAEVLKIGPEVTGEEIDTDKVTKKNKKDPAIFSYKYKFKNPITGKIETAYDDLVCVEIGEQIYDVGETVPVIFSNKPNKETGKDFTVTRKIIFPEIINKKKKRIKIVRAVYLIVLFALIFICMCFSLSNQTLENGSGIEQQTEISTEK